MINPLKMLTKNESEQIRRLRGRLQMIRRRIMRVEKLMDEGKISTDKHTKELENLTKQEEKILKELDKFKDR